MASRSVVGSAGEDIAASFLRNKGFLIIERNFRAGRAGEIDIVARQGDLVIFVEVKRRRSDSYGDGRYAITEAKKRRFRAAAKAFLASRIGRCRPDMTFRFDCILIQGDTVEWVEDMFR